MGKTSRRWGMGLGLCLLVAGCSKGAEVAPDDEQTSQGAERSQPRSWRERPSPEKHMQANFWLAVDVRDAIIAGDLEAARAPARELAERNYKQSLPVRWLPMARTLQQAAREVADATELKSAAAGVANIALSCGECHYNFQAGPERDAEEDQGFPPEGPEDLETRMLRHEWAVDEFWYGLTIPSDSSWRMGARVLIDAPITPPEHQGDSITPEAADAVEEVRSVGKQAKQAGTLALRARVYGQLLTTCSRCHQSGE